MLMTLNNHKQTNVPVTDLQYIVKMLYILQYGFILGILLLLPTA